MWARAERRELKKDPPSPSLLISRPPPQWFAFERRFVVGSPAAGGTEEDEQAAAAEAEVALLAAAQRRRWMRVAHGASMAAAFAVLSPLGVLAARYFKHLEPAWFVAHRRLQWAALALSLPSFLLAALVLHPYLPYGPHGLVGTVVMAGMLAQPLVASWRPGKSSPDRSVRVPAGGKGGGAKGAKHQRGGIAPGRLCCVPGARLSARPFIFQRAPHPLPMPPPPLPSPPYPAEVAPPSPLAGRCGAGPGRLQPLPRRGPAGEAGGHQRVALVRGGRRARGGHLTSGGAAGGEAAQVHGRAWGRKKRQTCHMTGTARGRLG